MNPELQAALLAASDALPHDGELVFKPMFGGACAYFNGRVFASLSNVGLALKISDREQEQLLELGGRMLQYEADAPISKSYVVLPEQIWQCDEQLSIWARKSVDYVLTLPLPKRRKR